MSFFKKIQNFFNEYYKYLLFIIIIFIFIFIAYYFYKKNVSPKLQKNNFTDVANTNQRVSNADLYYFYVDWCPQCKKTKPEWDAFMSQNDGRMVNGYKLSCHSVNCTDDGEDNPDINEIIKRNKITYYPTLKMKLDNGEQVEFDAKITEKSLEKFVSDILDK